MGTKERREREKLDTREKILAAAREMFATEGYDAVTMRAIAERIEYTPTALYHHFQSKQALLNELCQSDFLQLAKFFRGGGKVADPIERIVAIGRAYLGFALEHPSQYRFMFMTVLPELEPSAGSAAQPDQRGEQSAYAFLRETCQEAIDAGRLKPEFRDPDTVAQIMWATIHGIISLRIVKQHDAWVHWKDARESAELAMRSHLQGMLRTS